MIPKSPGARRRRLRLLDRREFLAATAATAAVGISAGIVGGCSLDSELSPLEQIRPDGPEVAPAKAPDWLRDARVAGIEAFIGQQPRDIKITLDQLADERVSVVEIDPELSAYLTLEGFKQQTELLDLYAKGCHMRGMRAVVYYPTLEVLTKDAHIVPHSMYKDHPDWIQISITGKPNKFLGGEPGVGKRVFWVEKNEESAWCCPTSGYVDYFNARVEALARTDLDGLWGDVPLFSDIVGVWPCINDTCNALFKKATGFDAPHEVKWDDEAFRAWIKWRHEAMWGFEQKVVATAKKVRSSFEVIIETVTMDYTAGTVQGLDGADADDGLIYRVWEVDAVSDGTGMQDASRDDWASMAVMMRHGNGCSSPRPAWIFSYGLKDDDAEHVMALAISAGNNPYESKIPIMNTSTGTRFRKRMFSWLERNVAIYQSAPANNVAIIFSAASRDFVDQAKGVGLYTSVNDKDKLWWSTRAADSAIVLDYMGDYRGSCKLMFEAHSPYDLLTTPHATPEKLAQYGAIIAPSLAAMNDKLVVDLKKWVDTGGTLILSGSDAGHFDKRGKVRPQPAAIEAFGLLGSLGSKTWQVSDVGAGRLYFHAERVGKTFFHDETPELLARYIEAISVNGRQVIITEKATNPSGTTPLLSVNIRVTTGGDTLLVLANLKGLGEKGGVGQYTPQDLDATFSLLLPQGKTPGKVTLSVPDEAVADKAATFKIAGGRVIFDAKVHSLLLATIQYIA